MTLKQIHSAVREFLSPSFDTENIACDLWVEAFCRQTEKSINLETDNLLDLPLSREVVRNRCVDEMRKRKTEKKFEYSFGDFCFDQDNDDNMEMSILDRLMEKLSPEQKEVIFQKFYLGCTIKKISEILHMNHKTTEKILASALETLRAVAREKESEK